MFFVLNAANFITVFLWYWFFCLQMSFTFKALHTFLYLFKYTFKCCLAPSTHSHWNQNLIQLPPLPGPICEEFPAISCKTCFFYSHLWKFLFCCDGLKKQKNTCEKFDWHNGVCVSDWLLCLSVVSCCLSAVVITALKLIIWSGEQLLCAESLEQRGQMVTIE